MPIEYTLLRDAPEPFVDCPACGSTFHSIMRGLVQRSKRAWWNPTRVRPYCAVICATCRELVSYELPPPERNCAQVNYLATVAAFADFRARIRNLLAEYGADSRPDWTEDDIVRSLTNLLGGLRQQIRKAEDEAVWQRRHANPGSAEPGPARLVHGLWEIRDSEPGPTQADLGEARSAIVDGIDGFHRLRAIQEVADKECERLEGDEHE